MYIRAPILSRIRHPTPILQLNSVWALALLLEQTNKLTTNETTKNTPLSYVLLFSTQLSCFVGPNTCLVKDERALHSDKSPLQ